ALISVWTRQHDAEAIEEMLQAAGVEAAAVATPRDVWLDSQLRHRGFFELVSPAASAPELGPRPHLRPSWRTARSPAGTRRRAPEFGEHTREVLTGLLGLSERDLSSLEADGVIASAPMPGVLARPGPMDLDTLLASGRL